MKAIFKFLTNAVVLIIVFGVLLIITGDSSYLSKLFPSIPGDSFWNAILKSIGAALLGSGVFTAIIKSNEYTQVFSKVIENIIWSKEFIKKRSDKRQIWSMVSRSLYEEKFPDISDAIEEIITSQYFPITHDFYIQEYDFIVNVNEYNSHFWKQNEVLKIRIKCTNGVKQDYLVKTAIDLPPEGIPDETNCQIDEIIINGENMPIPDPQTDTSEKTYSHIITLPLSNKEEHNIVLKRTKILCKSTNADKRFFARYFQTNSTVSVIVPTGVNIDFHRMGTINDFEADDIQHNGGSKVYTWRYRELILPNQGYFMIFK